MSTDESPLDPTTAAIEAQIEERDRLRAENARLSKALVEACTEVEVVKADWDRMFVEGYNQAVREIRKHFAEAGRPDVVHEIEKIWLKSL